MKTNIIMNTETLLNEYHVCYVKNENNCTGINIKAKNYIDALKKFNLKLINKKIIYICLK